MLKDTIFFKGLDLNNYLMYKMSDHYTNTLQIIIIGIHIQQSITICDEKLNTECFEQSLTYNSQFHVHINLK